MLITKIISNYLPLFNSFQSIVNRFELFPPANDNLLKFLRSSFAARLRDVVNRGKKSLVGRQTAGDEERKGGKKWRKKGSETREGEREDGGWSHEQRVVAASGKRVSCDRHIFRADALTLALPLRSPRVRCAPHRRHNPPRPCACLPPPPSYPFYSLSSPPRHERPSLTYEWRRLVSGNSRRKAIRRASIVCPRRARLSRSSCHSFDSRPVERERATMILRRVGGRADIFLDKISQQHVIKTLSVRRPSRLSAIFSSWNCARL